VERLLAWYRVTSSVGAVVALVVANLIPLVGALWFGWNVWTILIIYWLENGVVGVVNVLKMRKAEGSEVGGAANWRINGRPATSVARGALIPFFVMHYGMFWIGHGIFVLLMPVFGGIGTDGSPGPDMTQGVSIGTIAFAVALLAISHGVSYRLNFVGNGEYRRVSPVSQMFAPYGRLVILHITIIVGAMAISLTGAPAAALAILVVLKIVLDVGFHLAEHRKVASLPAGTPPIVDAAMR
jgi:hypothetical protein